MRRSPTRVVDALPLVSQQARLLMRSRPPSLEYRDLVQEGVLGLMDADARYDHRPTTSFRTFASIRIRGAILDAIRRTNWPAKFRARLRAMDDVILTLTASLHRPPTRPEIADSLGLTAAEMRQTTLRGATLDAMASSTPVTDVSRLPACYVPAIQLSPLARYARLELHDRLMRALRALSPRDRTVIQQYYGRERTMTQIAGSLACSQAHISNCHAGALRQLRQLMGPA